MEFYYMRELTVAYIITCVYRCRRQAKNNTTYVYIKMGYTHELDTRLRSVPKYNNNSKYVYVLSQHFYIKRFAMPMSSRH